MSGPRILKNYDALVIMTNALRERIKLAESRGEILLVDGVSLLELLDAIRQGKDRHEFDGKNTAARVALVRSGKDFTIYGPDVRWPAAN